MKRVFALILALVLTIGAYSTTYAQTVNSGVGYNVVINGQGVDFTEGEAINVEGVSMFTAESYVQKFVNAGLTEDAVKESEPFNYNGADYYSLRDVAANNGLNVFWDEATHTALVISKDNYEKIKEMVEASNAKQSDFNSFEADMNGNVDVSVDAGGQVQSMSFPIEMGMKFDLEDKYIEYSLKTSFMGTELNITVYDDGEFTYTNSGDGWIKTESQTQKSFEMAEQIKAMNPSVNALAEELSIAGLSITDNGDGYILEGDMYVSETFNGIDFTEIMTNAYAELGMEMEFNINWPKTVYVKYDLKGDGDINSMSMKFDMDMGIVMQGDAVNIGLSVAMDIPKFTIDSDFDTVVPQEVKETAEDFTVDFVIDE